jgi:sulfopyruvate decarboxylase TPP-binding subunit
MMQTSGFALIANALASLIVPYQIPAILVVSERGTLGEFNIGQVTVARTMRPVLDSIAVTHHTLTEREMQASNVCTPIAPWYLRFRRDAP